MFYARYCITNKSALSQPSFNTVVHLHGSVQESFLGRRFLVRAGGYRGLLVSFSSVDVKPYPADMWESPWGQHQECVSWMLFPYVSHSGGTPLVNSSDCGGCEEEQAQRSVLFFIKLFSIFSKQRWWQFPLHHHSDVLKAITPKGRNQEGEKKKRNCTNIQP